MSEEDNQEEHEKDLKIKTTFQGPIFLSASDSAVLTSSLRTKIEDTLIPTVVSIQAKLAPIQLAQSHLNKYLDVADRVTTLAVPTPSFGKEYLDILNGTQFHFTTTVAPSVLKATDTLVQTLPNIERIVGITGQSLSNLQNFITNSGILDSMAVYDVRDARTSLATSAVDTLGEFQKSLLVNSDRYSVRSPEFTSSMLGVAGLSALSVEAISPLYTIPVQDKKADQKDVEDLKSKVEDLERKLQLIKTANDEEFVSKANEKIKKWLYSLNRNLGQCFEASNDTFYDLKNKDRMGQSAESMIRVIEYLPDFLADQSKLLSKTEKDKKKESLTIYLSKSTNYTDEYKTVLIDKQSFFYGKLGLRHRKTPSYQELDENPSLYKGLLLDIDSWILALIASQE